MSLVNDALKRAKQAQKNDAAAPRSGPQLRPAELSPHPRRNGLALPVAVFVVIALVALFVWQTSQKTEPRPPVPVVQVPEPSPTPVPPPSAAVPKPPEPAVVIPKETPVTNAVRAAIPPPPTAPKLQALFFNPTRPSAMVNGKTVAVGAHVGEFRVAAIDQASVTLVSATQTNVLTLE
jgi:hypothetical protein